jgi:hypothetical protein
LLPNTIGPGFIGVTVFVQMLLDVNKLKDAPNEKAAICGFLVFTIYLHAAFLQ